MKASSSRRSNSALVSIIVPCRISTIRQAALLAETLATVAEQTFTDYELIVVDDDSPVSIREAVSVHANATVVRQQHGGVALARNTGIRRSRGEYLVFLDSDDHLLPPALEAGLRAFAAHPECGFVVGPREEMTFEGAAVPWSVSPPPPQVHLYLPLLGFEWYIIPPSSVMFHRRVVTTIGGFQDPWGADDLDFYLRAAWHFTASCYQSPPVTRYRRYSTSSSRDGERMLRSVRAVYERQWPVVSGHPEGEAAYNRGLRALTEIFRDCLVENFVDRVRGGDRAGALRAARCLVKESSSRWEQLLASDDAVVAALATEISAAAGGAEI